MNQLMIVVDGNSLMHRAFHAIPELNDEQGNPTNAIYGFISMLLKVLLERKPSYLAVAFDLHGPTFRHDVFANYKGTRKPTDESLRPQFPMLKELLRAMNISIIETPRFEADDILGTLSKICESHNLRTLLITGDRDALQLATEKTHVLYTKRGITETVEFDPGTVKSTYGVTPAQIPHLKGLMGDASDNIPGVPGVGEKTALKLLDEYGTLFEVLNHVDDQKGKLKERLGENKALAEQSLWLATIHRDVPITLQIEDCVIGDLSGAVSAFKRLDFLSLLPRLEKLMDLYCNNPMPQATETDTPQVSHSTDWQILRTAAEICAFVNASDRFALHWDGDITLATDGRRARIPIQQDMLSEGFQAEEAFELLRPLLSREASVCLFDAKKLMHTLNLMGLSLDGHCIHDDALLGGWLLNPLSFSKTLRAIYGEATASEVWDLCIKQEHELKQLQMYALYHDVELPLLVVLLSMERAGFLVDRDELLRLGKIFTEKEYTLRNEIITCTGGIQFNINSPKQLGEVLFERLGLPTGRKTKSGYSTDADTLEALLDAHPAIEKILEYRQVTKLNATYIDGLRSQIGSDGRVRSFFDQTATVTGRLSSNEPNLQNIPIRTPMGRDIRRAFIAPEGWVLVDADYSQIELRILAHLSGDEGMIQAFANQEDIHSRTAAEVYGVPLEHVTSEMRSAAKAVNFGIVYGISDFGLARNIGVTRKEASEFIARYFVKYPGVKQYLDQIVADGKVHGYVKTSLGRRRPLPELSSSNYNTRSFGERAAMNMPIQGAAADIIKLAMIRVHEELSALKLKARLILQVHDELIIECPEAEREQVTALLRECMETATLQVPLKVDVHYGKTWYDAH